MKKGSLKNHIRKVFRAVYLAEKTLLIVLMICMVIVLFLQVLFRYVFNSPLLWTEELSRYLLVWIGMAGIGYGMKENLHVKLEAFFRKMKPKTQNIVSVIICCVCIFSFAYMFPLSIDFFKDQSSIKASSLPITYGAVSFSLCLGCVLMILHCAEALLEIYWGREQ